MLHEEVKEKILNEVDGKIEGAYSKKLKEYFL